MLLYLVKYPDDALLYSGEETARFTSWVALKREVIEASCLGKYELHPFCAVADVAAG